MSSFKSPNDRTRNRCKHAGQLQMMSCVCLALAESSKPDESSNTGSPPVDGGEGNTAMGWRSSPLLRASRVSRTYVTGERHAWTLRARLSVAPTFYYRDSARIQ